jgi:DNA-binding LytR/AlgR family response regulator
MSIDDYWFVRGIVMINFAFCYEQKDELDFVKNEVLKCFRQREIEAAIMCFHSAYELLRCINSNCPDVLFYDMESEDGLVREAAKAAKKRNKHLISVVTKSNSYTPIDDDILLEPVYTMPDRSRKHLWAYASLAYEAYLDDYNSFSYYVRPDFVHVPIDDIYYFASEGRRTHIVSGRQRDTFYQKLDEVESLIKSKHAHFVRIHKSYLVNARYISCYSREFVTLTTGEKLRISKYKYYKLLNDTFRDLDFAVKRIAGYC